MATKRTLRERSEPVGLPVVEITITPDRVAFIKPAPTGLIELLTETRQEFIPDGGPTGYRRVRTTAGHGKLGPGDCLRIDVGLLPRVLRRLDECECPYHVDDRRERPPRFRPDRGVLDGLDADGRGLVEAVLREPQGQIEVAGPRAAVEACVTICRAHPVARIVLAVATKKQAWHLWRALTRGLGERVTLATTGTWIRKSRLLVGTMLCIPYRTLRQWDALILPCGEEATGEHARTMIGAMQFPQVYALVSARRPLDRGIGLLLEQIAGPVIRPLGRTRVPVRSPNARRRAAERRA